MSEQQSKDAAIVFVFGIVILGVAAFIAEVVFVH